MAEQIPILDIYNDKKIIFFDGVCNLCNSSIQLIIKNDKRNIFSFSSLQSQFAINFFFQHHYKRKTDSIIYWNGQRFYEQSTAALKICRHLKFPYPIFLTGWVIPVFIRNAIYAYIARNRYKWYGIQESCMVPSAELRSRFLD